MLVLSNQIYSHIYYLISHLHFSVHELFLPFTHSFGSLLFVVTKFTSTKTNNMKKITNNANAIIKSIVACTAKANAFKTSKTFFLFFFAAMTLMLSSCARNSMGCGNGTWACKGNAKYNSAKYSSSIYKCPSNQRYSRQINKMCE